MLHFKLERAKEKKKSRNFSKLEDSINVQEFLKSVEVFFQDVPDPRVKDNCQYSLSELLFIMLLAVFSGADTIEDVHTYADCKWKLMEKLFGEEFTTPSYMTFWWLLTRMDPKAFAEAFHRWAQNAYICSTIGKQINIDGKSLRGACNKKGNCNVHIVHAWAHEQGLLIGQKKTDEKSNEITAIPTLLSQIDIKGAVVSIDAAGCQKNIAKIIHRLGGYYLLAVKENQPNLYDEMVILFEDARKEGFEYVLNCDMSETVEKKSGRITKRTVTLIGDPSEISVAKEWEELETLIEVVNETTTSKGVTKETRYYISNLIGSAKEFGSRVRAHWSIESMHWSLDVTFREDDSRANALHAAVNLATLRRTCLNIVKSNPDLKKLGMAKARRHATWGNDEGIARKIIETLFTVNSF